MALGANDNGGLESMAFYQRFCLPSREKIAREKRKMLFARKA